MPLAPQSVLFCCDFNAVRSPMAEAMARKFYPRRIFVQSAGVRNELDIDGFSVAVCAEIDVHLERHKVRSFHDMEEWGDRIDAYDLIVALSPAAQRQALEYTRYHAIDVEYWPVEDPTGLGETREAKLTAYRRTRDQIRDRIIRRFGPPDPPPSPKKNAATA
ncbi:low molecular weight phosphatase family protein [Amaricoccus solimangrovi]|uniref:Low molecular weight phosphatase family protein n=1 Tax=Amaricoccus solimangrovi TaxID=2589815 RepID=A0A501WXS4_9RHOB|nr:low molecular weight phosphatase family protein [Amaricoccus solimangrovi]TPE50696.1 low molecular weight phosphatase family protein [Amaricoccus solimangrovi]